MAGVGVELAGRLGQRQVGDLLEVLVGDAAAAVAGGDRVGDPHVELHDLGQELGTLALGAVGGTRQEVCGAGGALGALGGVGSVTRAGRPRVLSGAD